MSGAIVAAAVRSHSYPFASDDPFDKPEPNQLRDQNPVPLFDNHIDFDDAEHRYFVDGQAYTDSTTSFIHSFFTEFNADAVIKNMFASRNYGPSHRYWDQTAEEIKAGWETNRITQAALGTEMHEWIERFYNGHFGADDLRFVAYARSKPELLQFLRFHDKEVEERHWRPFRTELRVFNREHRLAGSVDMLFYDPAYADGKHLIMLDWKRSKEIKRTSFAGRERGLKPLSHLHDCNYWHYALQLNTYKWMIERTSDYRVTSMHLGVFHPNHSDYEMYTVPDLQTEVANMMQIRSARLASAVPAHEHSNHTAASSGAKDMVL